MNEFRQALRRFGYLPVALIAVSLGVAGCNKSADQSQTANPATPDATTQDGSNTAPASANPPADANLAPVSGSYSSGQSAAPAAEQQSAPASSDNGANYANADYYPPDNDGEQPVYAPQPPPPLPTYEQPECPGDNYLWTPGYWSYAPQGYYFVPGAWVMAPYTGALWTPGYWGYSGNRYGFHHGYWGPHIGYYGGINYGFGYIGVGYQGGYWNHGDFAYNRSVNNINITIIHTTNVYNQSVNYHDFHRDDHVSFNGGHGGVQYRPSPAELVAVREQHVPPLPAQIQLVHQAASTHAQFAKANGGHPSMFVAARPVDGGRKAPAPPPPAVRAALRPTALPRADRPSSHVQPPATNRPNEPVNRPATEPNRPAEANRPAPNRPETGPNRPAAEPAHVAPGERPAAQTHPTPESRPAQQTHPAPQRPADRTHEAPARPSEESRPAPHAAAPAPRVAEKPAAAPRAARPAPEHAAPAAHPAAHPEQRKPEEKKPQ